MVNISGSSGFKITFNIQSVEPFPNNAEQFRRLKEAFVFFFPAVMTESVDCRFIKYDPPA